jgi:hypothetical protein
MSTQSNIVNVTIEKRSNATGLWETVFGPQTATGWPAHHYIPHPDIYYESSLSNAVRITFQTTRADNTYGVALGAIEWLGTYPAGRRNVEFYDRDQNVTFPSGVYSSATLQMLQPAGGIGRVSVTNGLSTVTGERTQFLTTFKVGDNITVVGQTRIISSITNNTQLTVSSPFTITYANVGYVVTGGSRFAVTGNGNVGIGGTISDLSTMAGASMVVNSGNVGIGTNNPQVKLDVNGGTFRVISDGAKFSLLENDVSSSNGFFNLSNAVTAPNFYSPLLHMKGNTTGGGYVNAIIGDMNSDIAGQAALEFMARANGSTVVSADLFRFSNLYGSGDGSTSALVIKANNSVGIGTSSVTANRMLDVNGEVRIRDLDVNVIPTLLVGADAQGNLDQVALSGLTIDNGTLKPTAGVEAKFFTLTMFKTDELITNTLSKDYLVIPAEINGWCFTRYSGRIFEGTGTVQVLHITINL